MAKSKITGEDVRAYIQGNIRELLFYNFPSLIRLHIREQIVFRLGVLDKECYANGSCKMCGCMIPGLQMANKSCPKPCYPEMKSKKEWLKFKTTEEYNVYTKITS